MAKITQCEKAIKCEVEVWRDIPTGKKEYQVSNFGRVRTKDRIVKHNWGGPKRVKGKELKPYRTGNGRYQVSIWENGKRRPFLVHRLVMLAFVGECPQNMEVRHLNSNPADNRLCNLAYGTRSENTIDTARLGRLSRQKLTPEIVKIIRYRLANGELIKNLAAQYEVSTRTISDIKNRHTYSWLEDAM